MFIINLQFILIVAASSVGEELFYRVAIQVRYISISNTAL